MRLLHATIAVALATTTTLLADAQIDKIRALKMFKSPNIKILGMQENKSTYQVKAVVDNQGKNSMFEAFVTKDYKEVIIGKGFDAQTQKPLLIAIDMKEHLSKAAYSIGSGEEEYLVFTDPECPYCQKLEKLLPSLAKHARFHVFLFPLSFHKNAKQMSYHIINQKDVKSKQKAMSEIANGGTKYREAKFSLDELQALELKLQEQMGVASMLGVNGTPAVFNTSGETVQWLNLFDKYGVKKPTF